MNLDKVPPLSLAERDRRWNLVRSFLVEQDLDALIVYGEHEDAGAAPYSFDNWLTNDRPGATIVFPKNGEPIELVPFLNFFVDHMEGLENNDAIWIPVHNMRAGRDWESLANVLTELSVHEGNIGVMGLEPALPWHPEGIIPFQILDKVKSRFPLAAFKSVGDDLVPILLPFSDEELAIIRYGASIGESMAKAMVEVIKVGVSEHEVYAAGMATALSQGTIVPWMHLNTGPNAVVLGPPRWAWRPQSPRTLQNGDLVASEVFCSYGMKQTQHQLTVMIGPIPEDIAKASAVARECYEAGLKMLQPGARFGDVADAMFEPVERAGGWTKGPQIHSLNPIAALCGFSPPPHIVGKGYTGVKGIPTRMADMRLVPGMTMAFEPSCGFGVRGVTIGGTVIVGEDGAIELNPFTARLHQVS